MDKELLKRATDGIDKKRAGEVMKQAGKDAYEMGRKGGGKLSDLIDKIFDYFN
jgi:hypothetical protein